MELHSWKIVTYVTCEVAYGKHEESGRKIEVVKYWTINGL